MNPIVYRKMNTGEEQQVCGMVERVFNDYVALDYAQDGVEEFFRFANADAMKERVQSGSLVMLAWQADALVGMLEFNPPDRIAMLFVSVHHQGIAKNLLTQTISEARSQNQELSKLTVHSSPYAELVYQKMGFRKTGDTTTTNGITYTPMELLLKK